MIGVTHSAPTLAGTEQSRRVQAYVEDGYVVIDFNHQASQNDDGDGEDVTVVAMTPNVAKAVLQVLRHAIIDSEEQA